MACAPKEPPEHPRDRAAVLAAPTLEAAVRSSIVFLPRPPFEPANYLPDFHDELRWPLSSMSHPSLEPRFPIAQAFAQPGVGWIELCGLGVQNRFGGDKDLLSYLRGWCSAIKGDVDAACTHLVPLVGSTTLGIDDAVKTDLANILADQGHADRAEHWINVHHIRDVEILDLLAANYVEVGTDRDAATINRLAMDSDDRATAATRCARMTRQIVLAGNSASLLLEGMRQIASSKGKTPEPTCQKLLNKLECWRARGAEACEPYWNDVGISGRVRTMIAAHDRWRLAQRYSQWRSLADETMGIVPFEGAAAYALAALDNAIRTGSSCNRNDRAWLEQNAVTLKPVLATAPELEQQFERLWTACHQPAASK